MMMPARFLIICCLATICHVSSVNGTVTLTNNGYEGVIVYISSAVKEDTTLIQNIKNVLSEASDQLFFSTKNRAFFRNICIVVPKSWTNTAIEGTIPAVNKFGGYIRIDKPMSGIGHRPYVRGNLECGKSAWYMHLTPGFIRGQYTTQYGYPAKAVVHEWGHLRWGLFDEYPSIVTKSTAPYRVNYFNGGGKWNPVTCSKQVTGNAYQGNCDVTRSCALDNLTIKPSCKFCANTVQTATASFMGSQWMDSIVHFCEKDDNTTPESVRHDSTAPNLQNKMCNHRSSWEVMEEHEDFSGGNNPPVSLQSLELPTFKIVQEKSKVRMFVYDVSGSMNSNSKITKQADSSYVVIDNVVETGSYLGLVMFNSAASTLAELTEVTNSTVRDTLKLTVPRSAGGGTQIYQGLLEAIQVIESGPFPTEGAEIVLLSDGMSNSPYSQITPTLVEKSIIVHTIAITNAADPLMAKLAADTGGNSFTYLETDSVTFADVLIQATVGNSLSVTAAFEILSSTYTLTRSSPVSGVFYIDDGLGTDTTLTVIQSSGVSINVSVVDPNTAGYTTQGTDGVLTLKLDGISPIGLYSFTITTTSSGSLSLEVMVSSTQTSDDVDPIQVTSYLNSSTMDFNSANQVRLTAVVQKGTTPVLNATVTAVLAADAYFTPINLSLSDTGTGADVIYWDGIYSTYLLKKYLTANSAYTIKVYVEGSGDAYTQGLMADGADSVPGTVDDTNTTTTDAGNFTRQSVTGEITVDNYVSNPADTTPPSQITDFRVEDIMKVDINGVEGITYTLAWTAVGSDMDIGQAQTYDMRLNPDIQLLQSSFSQSSLVPATLPAPQQSGLTESINITFGQTDCVGICYLAVTATDENGLSGDVSNAINIDVDFSYIGDITYIVVPGVSGDSTKDSIVLVLVLSLLAVVIALVILALVVYKFLYRKKKGKIQTKVNPFVDPVFKMEQADECEKLRLQYYDLDNSDAVIPITRSDFNSRPSFLETRTVSERGDPGTHSLDDGVLGDIPNVFIPQSERMQVVKVIHEEATVPPPYENNKPNILTTHIEEDATLQQATVEYQRDLDTQSILQVHTNMPRCDNDLKAHTEENVALQEDPIPSKIDPDSGNLKTQMATEEVQQEWSTKPISDADTPRILERCTEMESIGNCEHNVPTCDEIVDIGDQNGPTCDERIGDRENNAPICNENIDEGEHIAPTTDEMTDDCEQNGGNIGDGKNNAPICNENIDGGEHNAPTSDEMTDDCEQNGGNIGDGENNAPICNENIDGGEHNAPTSDEMTDDCEQNDGNIGDGENNAPICNENIDEGEHDAPTRDEMIDDGEADAPADDEIRVEPAIIDPLFAIERTDVSAKDVANLPTDVIEYN